MGTLFEWTVDDVTPTLKEKPKMQKRTIKAQLIRLADAMMKGGKKRQQCTGNLFDVDTVEQSDKKGDWIDSYKLGGSCALGAVYEGLFGTPPITDEGQVNGGDGEMYARLTKRLPVLDLSLNDITDAADDVFGDDSTLQDSIIFKNDTAGFARWQIAKWIRRLAAAL